MPVPQAPPVIPDHGSVRWSISLRDTATGEVLHEHDPHRALPTASVAKVFVLGDIAVLVAAASDNWATNALIDRLTLEAVQDRAHELAPGGSTLHDYVRDERTEGHPPTLSEGTSADWSLLLALLAEGRCVNESTSTLVRTWLTLNTDLSMVAAAAGLDPLAHTAPDLGLSLWNKTGTDLGVRAEVGVVSGGDRALSYACLASWDDDGSGAVRHQVLGTMRALGEFTLATLTC